MEGENVKRNSSIEMVRIIAMMFIVVGHLAGHGILKVTTTDSFEMWLHLAILIFHFLFY